MGFFKNPLRCIEKKVFGVENRANSQFVDHTPPPQPQPSPGRQEACWGMGYGHAKTGANAFGAPDPISDGIDIAVMGCNREPYNVSYGNGYMAGLKK